MIIIDLNYADGPAFSLMPSFSSLIQSWQLCHRIFLTLLFLMKRSLILASGSAIGDICEQIWFTFQEHLKKVLINLV